MNQFLESMDQSGEASHCTHRRLNGPILGIHMVGSRVGELVSEAQLIFNWEASASDVAPLIHAHPTLSESMGEAHMALAGKPLHAHG